jgi:hypothetical protein
MDALREAVEAAFANYRKGLIQLIVRTLTTISRKDPQAKYEYTAGMGIWYFKRTGMVTEDGETSEQEDDDYEPEGVYEAIQDADTEYNGAATPGGELVIQAGKILVNTLN